MKDEELCERFETIRQLALDIREDLKVLRHIVVEGNGSPPLTVQVARNGERIEAIEPVVDRLTKIADEGRFDRRSKGAVLVALLALIGTIAVPVLQHLLG